MRIEQAVTRLDCVGVHLDLKCLIVDTQIQEKGEENKDDKVS